MFFSIFITVFLGGIYLLGYPMPAWTVAMVWALCAICAPAKAGDSSKWNLDTHDGAKACIESCLEKPVINAA